MPQSRLTTLRSKAYDANIDKRGSVPTTVTAPKAKKEKEEKGMSTDTMIFFGVLAFILLGR